MIQSRPAPLCPAAGEGLGQKTPPGSPGGGRHSPAQLIQKQEPPHHSTHPSIPQEPYLQDPESTLRSTYSQAAILGPSEFKILSGVQGAEQPPQTRGCGALER